TATSHSTCDQLATTVPKQSDSTRASAANAATFTPAAMKAVMVVGAPSYTSGIQPWNGTIATLKPKPTRRSARPSSTNGSFGVFATGGGTGSRWVVPAGP